MRASNATCRSAGAGRPIRELTRVEVEEGAGRGQGQSYGDLEAIDVGFAPECVAGTSGDSLQTFANCGDVVEFRFNV